MLKTMLNYLLKNIIVTHVEILFCAKSRIPDLPELAIGVVDCYTLLSMTSGEITKICVDFYNRHLYDWYDH